MPLHEMKGPATTVLVRHSATRGRLELARFADGSWAIRQPGPTVSVWEPDERAECFRVFAMLTGQRVPADPQTPATPTPANTWSRNILPPASRLRLRAPGSPNHTTARPRD